MSTPPDKTIPSNIQAEEALLGSLMIDSDAVIQVATIVAAEDFYVQRHAVGFATNMSRNHGDCTKLTHCSRIT